MYERMFKKKNNIPSINGLMDLKDVKYCNCFTKQLLSVTLLEGSNGDCPRKGSVNELCDFFFLASLLYLLMKQTSSTST